MDLVISKFLGVRYSLTGDTGLKIGELSDALNVRITDDLKIRKREGYKSKASTGHTIRGQWQGYINGVFTHLYASNGHIYKIDGTDIGTLTDAPTQFFYFGQKLYIINGHEYKSYDGTTYQDVAGYVPKIAVATPPTGSGTDLEPVNLLSQKKRQGFRSNGTTKVYKLRESNITSIDFVKLNGATKTLTTDYTVNLSTGEVTFVVQPLNWTGSDDDVEIGWTKDNGFRSQITGYTQFAFYGGKNDTRVFLYGDGTNRMHFSDLANGIPSAEYFPATNSMDVGSDENHITSVLKQYDRLLIYSPIGAYYSVYEYDTTLGANFPVYPLNDKIGNIPLGQGQLIQNNPFTVTNMVYQWVATSVRDERNAMYMSERVQPLLDELDLSGAVTFDFEEISEYWLCVVKKVFIYNYRNDTWYPFELAHTPTSFITIDGVLFMGTEEGHIMEWAKYNIDTIPIYLTDDGETIHSYAETGAMDYGKPWVKKFIPMAWIGMKPESKSRCIVSWESNLESSKLPMTINYSLFDLNSVDFGDFSFLVNYNPQPFALKFKARNFVYLKVKVSNDSSTETMTILNITLPAMAGGVAK